MKKALLYAIIGGAVILIIGAAVAFFYLDSIVKTGFETVGPKVTKVEMKLGGARLSPFSGHGALKEMFIGNPEGFKALSAIKVGEVRIGVKPRSVFADAIEVDEITIESPEITFEGTLQGNNISKLLANIEAAAGGGAKEAPGEKPSKRFFVKEITIRNGRINASLTMLGGKPLSVSLPEIHLQNVGSKEKPVGAAELAKQILSQVLESSVKAVGLAMTKVGDNVKDVGKGAVENVDKASKGLKNLFKR